MRCLSLIDFQALLSLQRESWLTTAATTANSFRGVSRDEASL
jgi:hypothetical protein